MNPDIDRLGPAFDPRIADWFEGDPGAAPPLVLDTVLAALPSIEQRRAPARPQVPPWFRAAGWRVAAALAVVVTVGGLLVTNFPGRPSPDGAAIALHPIVSSRWTGGGEVLLTIRRDPNIDEPLYWRVATYDQITRNGWEQTDATVVTRPAHSQLMEGTDEDPGTRIGLRSGRFHMVPAAPAGSLLVSPATPLSASETVGLTLIGDAGFFGAFRSDARGSSVYEVTASIPIRGDGEGELNVTALRAAGTGYPSAITERYLGVADGIFGPNATALVETIERRAASRAPIDLVEATVDELRSGAYTYSTDVSRLDCEDLSTVECLATYRQGFCQYFATTMAASLRSMGVPARIAEGFLPGERSGPTETIRETDAHAWVEVYFPRYGWVPFDPTPVPQPDRLPVPLPPGRDGD